MTDVLVARNRWLLVAVAGLAVYMATLDSSIVNVALPSIEAQLRAGPEVVEWVALGYFLPLIALALPCGRWLDQVGKRAALVFAAVGFGATSVLCGLSPTISLLITFRVLQGAFGAVLFAMTPVLATMAVQPQARGRAMSVAATLGPLGAVSGPALGGLLVSSLGWQWIFYVNVPVCLVVVALGCNQLAADGGLRLPGREWLVEAALLGSAVTALLLGLTFAASRGPWWLAVSALAIPLTWVWTRTSSSVAPLRLLRTGTVVRRLIGLMTMMAAVAFVQYLAPFFLADVLRLSPGAIGMTVLAFPVAMALLGPVAGVVSDRWGPRLPQLAGAAFAACGLILLAPIGSDWGPVDLAWRLAVFGVGVGLYAAPNQSSLMSSAPRPLMATTGASASLVRQLGLSLGPAVATLVWAAAGYQVFGMGIVFGIGAVAAVIAGLTAVERRQPAPAAG